VGGIRYLGVRVTHSNNKIYIITNREEQKRSWKKVISDDDHLGTAGILQFCKNTRQNVFISYVTFQRAFYQWTHMP